MSAPESVSPVPSPCVSLCKMDRERRYCQGCLRTIDEIVRWRESDDDFRRAVLADIRRRESELPFD